MSSVARTYITPEQYLERVRAAKEKSEYLDGEIFAMAGAGVAHNLIALNVASELRAQLKGRPCVTFPSDLKVEAGPKGLYSYPDVSVVCGDAQFHDKVRDIVLNPKVIVEVLSPPTEAYDRGAKFAQYRRIGSLTDYIPISSDRPRVEHYARQDDGRWPLTETVGREGAFAIASIGCELLMSEVYDRVEFDAEAGAEAP